MEIFVGNTAFPIENVWYVLKFSHAFLNLCFVLDFIFPVHIVG